MRALQQLVDRLAAEAACLVQVQSTQGSVPREQGAWMAVFASGQIGTIGGGHLEWLAAERARTMLASGGAPEQGRYPLGPALGQCCGGVVNLGFRCINAGDAAALQSALAQPLAPVALFGAGHVGAALAQVLATLPVQLSWIDSRDAVFPAQLPSQVVAEHSEPIAAAVPALAPGSSVLILTHNHQQDFDITLACLQRLRASNDLGLVGLIGSATKRATFAHRLEDRGFGPEEFARITCPIGVPGITGKEPEVIAIAVAAQLLQYLSGQKQ